MLGKMIIHGLAAAIVIGSAAAVYAQVKDTAPPPAPAQVSAQVSTPGDGAAKPGDDGYIHPKADKAGRHHEEEDDED